MVIVRVSSKFQITIPKLIRSRLGINAGHRFIASEEKGRIILTPIPPDPIQYLRGILEGEPSLTEELLRDRATDAA